MLIVDGAVVLGSMATTDALERGDRSPVSLFAFGRGSAASYGFLSQASPMGAVVSLCCLIAMKRPRAAVRDGPSLT
ncbi:MAG: hypothetical protein ACYCXY_10985 [Acidimicrobiales bacterium]